MAVLKDSRWARYDSGVDPLNHVRRRLIQGDHIAVSQEVQ
jgi:hypothetical protein